MRLRANHDINGRGAMSLWQSQIHVPAIEKASASAKFPDVGSWHFSEMSVLAVHFRIWCLTGRGAAEWSRVKPAMTNGWERGGTRQGSARACSRAILAA
jgi:hypothetical protein